MKTGSHECGQQKNSFNNHDVTQQRSRANSQQNNKTSHVPRLLNQKLNSNENIELTCTHIRPTERTECTKHKKNMTKTQKIT